MDCREAEGDGMESNWVFSHVHQNARDKQEFVDYYQSIGIGVNVSRLEWPDAKSPSTPPPEALRPVSVTLINRKPDLNAPTPTTIEGWAERMTSLFIGDLHVEVYSSPTARFGTIGHVAFYVPDIYRETANLVRKGCEIPWTYLRDTLIGENIIDTSKFTDCMLQFRPDPNGWSGQRERAWIEGLAVSDWRFHGLEIPVRDLDPVVAYYQSLGIATLEPEVLLDSSASEDFMIYGKRPDATIKARTRTARVGSTVYQFVQPLEGETVYNESLDSRGEGVNGFAFIVDDLDRETAKLVEKGIPVVLSGKPETGSAFAYFDTRKVGDMTIGLIQA